MNSLTEQPLLGGVHLGRQPRRLREEDTGAASAVLAAVPASDVILPRPHRVLMMKTEEGEKSVKCVAIHRIVPTFRGAIFSWIGPRIVDSW